MDDPALAEFTCPICWDPFWQPVRTTCGHAFCEGCLLQAVQTQLGHPQPDVTCPLCRHPLQVKDVSADQGLVTRIRLALTERRKDVDVPPPVSKRINGRVHRGLANGGSATGVEPGPTTTAAEPKQLAPLVVAPSPSSPSMSAPYVQRGIGFRPPRTAPARCGRHPTKNDDVSDIPYNLFSGMPPSTPSTGSHGLRQQAEERRASSTSARKPSGMESAMGIHGESCRADATNDDTGFKEDQRPPSSGSFALTHFTSLAANDTLNPNRRGHQNSQFIKGARGAPAASAGHDAPGKFRPSGQKSPKVGGMQGKPPEAAVPSVPPRSQSSTPTVSSINATTPVVPSSLSAEAGRREPVSRKGRHFRSNALAAESTDAANSSSGAIPWSNGWVREARTPRSGSMTNATALGCDRSHIPPSTTDGGRQSSMSMAQDVAVLYASSPHCDGKAAFDSYAFAVSQSGRDEPATSTPDIRMRHIQTPHCNKTMVAWDHAPGEHATSYADDFAFANRYQRLLEKGA